MTKTENIPVKWIIFSHFLVNIPNYMQVHAGPIKLVQ